MKFTPDRGKAAKLSEAAFQMFLEQGYEATGIRSICKAAGAELPTLYYHFGSKKGLFLSLANSMRHAYDPDVVRQNRDYSSSAEEYLRDYFLFAVHYTIDHLPETRFFLRYSLFPPQEIKEEIAAFLEENQRAKNEMILPSMMECIRHGLVKLPIEQAMSVYWKFINNNTFDVVFSGWAPKDEELTNLWRTFVRCRLSNEHSV